ncbi:MAG TPA: hydrogen gas-evolving membrane-bound hydrogenase subunit E [Nitriliruptoraceae bacterium]|nr:hydrogen gas-evolving membrane-bound hydrogenase subunit E [Nitriliruptoraceae bacterium]
MALLAVLGLHGVVAIATGLLGRQLGRRVLVVALVAPLATVSLLVADLAGVIPSTALAADVPWVPGLGLSIDVALDGFGRLFWWLIGGIGVAVVAYAVPYFGRRDDLGRFAASLVTFMGAMLLLTCTDDVLVLFVAWELTSITSYLLIGFEDRSARARSSALQALLVTGAGGIALLGGLLLVAASAGTTSLTEILAVAPNDGVAQVGLALVVLAAATKSAQVPFHFWLPGAMAAPTPVSAYLHSATMVKAGVYLLARFAPAMAPAVEWWSPVVVTLGAVTMLLGGWRALRATDLKALLAFSTVSQLGLIVLLVGHGAPELVHAGTAVLLAHALFKAALFLAVGVIDHQAGTRDLRRLSGLGRRMRPTAIALGVSAASMAGVIPLLGFVAKETALEATLAVPGGGVAMTAVVVIGSVFTGAYSLRLVVGVLGTGDPTRLPDDAVEPDRVPRPTAALEAPAVVLAVLTVVLGIWVVPADVLVSAATVALAGTGAGDLYLVLWHGFGLALLLSAVAWLGGYLVWREPELVDRLARRTARIPDAQEVYRASLRGILSLADRVTAFVQPGSLPLYGAVVLATVLALPGVALVGGLAVPSDLVVAESGLQAAVAALVVVAAIGTARARRRLPAVLLLGAVGYSVAVLFVVQGAPDLALTQLVVETLSLGMFVLVLRQLPDTFEPAPWRFGRAMRAGLSVGIGVAVGAFTLAASSTGLPRSTAGEFLARSMPDGGGRNVVNVILTDFRALDTFAEITVLVVAAIGITLMVRTPLDDDDPELDLLRELGSGPRGDA